MKNFAELVKKSFAGGLALSLVLVSPGLAPYEALAQTRPVGVVTGGAVNGGVPIADPGAGIASGEAALSPLELSAGLGALPSLQAGGLRQPYALGVKKGKSGSRMPESQDPALPEGNNRPDTSKPVPGFIEGGGFRQSPGGPDDASDPDFGGRDGGGDSGLFSRARARLQRAVAGPDQEWAPAGSFFDGSLTRTAGALQTKSAVDAGPSRPLSLGVLESKEDPRGDLLGDPRGPPSTQEDEKKDERELDPKDSPSAREGKGVYQAYSMPGAGLRVSNRTLGLVLAGATVAYVAFQMVQGVPFFDVARTIGGAALSWGLVVIPSLTLHEWAHAKAATMLGDDTARQLGRLTLNPVKHIDPVNTVALPLLLILGGSPFVIGGAKPVPFSTYGLKNPDRARMLVGLAGPGMNLALAAVAAVGYRLLTGALGMGVFDYVPSVFASLVDINLTLAVFNMIPWAPFDGHHVFRRVPGIGPLLERVPPGIGMFLGFLAFLYGPTALFLNTLIGTLHHLLISAGAGAKSALAAAGLLGLFGSGNSMPPMPRNEPPKAESNRPASGPEAGPGSATPKQDAVDLVVELPKGRSVAQDVIPNLLDPNNPKSVKLFRDSRERLLRDLASAGLTDEVLKKHHADPQSGFRRISMATLRVDADKAAALKAELEKLGFGVHDNRRIGLPKPVEPENHPDRRVVTLDELVKIVNAERVHKELEARLGPPGLSAVAGLAGKLARLLLKAGGAANPKVPLAVVDSGVDKDASARLKRAVKKTINVTDGEPIDDIGHGTHVTDTAVAIDPWQNDVTVVKAFKDGWATTEDILKALTAAANEGAIIISNSWGDNQGDPKSPEAQLVRKLAEEGRIMVFAAGNEGPGLNTVGGPAIVVYNSPETGAPRVIAVAAADYRRLIARFSSRGEVSQALAGTEEGKNYPPKPDVTGMGVDLKAALPGGREGAYSGTSMATPGFAGQLSLLARKFGVTEVGKALDEIAKQSVESAVDTGRPRREQGKGFQDVDAADKALSAAGLTVQKTFWPGFVRRAAMAGARGLASPKLPRVMLTVGLVYSAVKGVLLGLMLPASLSGVVLGAGAALAAAAWVLRATGLLKDRPGLEKLLFAFGAGFALAGGVGLGVAATKSVLVGVLAAAPAALPLVPGITAPQFLPPANRLYPEAHKIASKLAADSGRDASKLEFVDATGSTSRRTLAWHFNFRVPASNGAYDSIRVTYTGGAAGGLNLSTGVTPDLPADHATWQGARPAPLAPESVSGAIYGPEGAVAAAQRAYPGFDADVFALRAEGGALVYTLHSADGSAVEVSAVDGAAKKVKDAPPAPPQAPSSGKALRALKAAVAVLLAVLAVPVGFVGGTAVFFTLVGPAGWAGMAVYGMSAYYAAKALRVRSQGGRAGLLHPAVTLLLSMVTLVHATIAAAAFVGQLGWFVGLAAAVALWLYARPGPSTQAVVSTLQSKRADPVKAHRHAFRSLRFRVEGELTTGRDPKEASQAVAEQADKLAEFFRDAAKGNPEAEKIAEDLASALGRFGAYAKVQAEAAKDSNAFRRSVRSVLDRMDDAAATAADRDELASKLDAVFTPVAAPAQTVASVDKPLGPFQWLGLTAFLAFAGYAVYLYLSFILKFYLGS